MLQIEFSKPDLKPIQQDVHFAIGSSLIFRRREPVQAHKLGGVERGRKVPD